MLVIQMLFLHLRKIWVSDVKCIPERQASAPEKVKFLELTQFQTLHCRRAGPSL